MSRISRHSGKLACALAAALAPTAAAVETMAVQADVVGTTPMALGYNLGHFRENSNAADWFRYSGVDSARLFMSVSDLEPTDDLAPVGDGVTDEASFFARRALLRANAADCGAPLSVDYVNWNYFTTNLGKLSTGNNALRYSHELATLYNAGVEVLVNLTASPGRFPLTSSTDWAGRWELWQHYYAVAYLLSRDYGVKRFSMFNEPNGSSLSEDQWHERLRICSDAIQAAIADMNARHGLALVPQVFAPTTANGAEKYHIPGIDVWGSTAVGNRHLMLDGNTGNNNYGGATQCAEVYRLFVKAAKGARPRHDIHASTGASPGVNTGLWSMATHDPATGTWHVFLANRDTSAIPLEMDFSQLPVPAENPVFVEEVSGRSSGGIVRMTSLNSGKLLEADMPAESIWLITLPGQAMVASTRTAVADTGLGDGTSKNMGGGTFMLGQIPQRWIRLVPHRSGSSLGHRPALAQLQRHPARRADHPVARVGHRAAPRRPCAACQYGAKHQRNLRSDDCRGLEHRGAAFHHRGYGPPRIVPHRHRRLFQSTARSREQHPAARQRCRADHHGDARRWRKRNLHPHHLRQRRGRDQQRDFSPHRHTLCPGHTV